MKLRKFKVLTSIILLCIILLNSILPTFAEGINSSIAEYEFEEAIESDDVSVVLENTEEKYVCKATIEDDFEDDAVLVMFNNKASLEFKDYNVENFSGIGVASVEQSEINKSIGNKIKKHLQIEESKKLDYNPSFIGYTIDKTNNNKISNDKLISSPDEAIITDIDVEDVQEYNQVIKLNLNKHNKQNVLNVIKELEKRDDVLIAEPNFCYHLCKCPNDTYFSKQFNYIDRIELDRAWDITTGSKNIRVGVIDTGIKRAHSDIKTNVNANIKYGSAPLGKSIDPLSDNIGHGTEVAGIIGAVGNNSKGIAGVCWDVDIISFANYSEIVEVDGKKRTSIYLQNFHNALEYAQINNVDIINCSFGDYSKSNLIYKYMQKFDGLIICAAGNETNNNDIKPEYPSSYDLDNIISVAATDVNDKFADFSNYGNESVDLTAPGVSVYTTGNSDDKEGWYVSVSGTSFSAPYVTGVASLIQSKYPEMAASSVKKAILEGVDKVSSLNGKVKSGGRLNAYKALKFAQENPKFTIVYNNNGGTGTTMKNTTAICGVPTKLRANTYSKDSEYKTFIGWYAQRKSDNKWLYHNGTTFGWYVEGTQPTDYDKYLYNEQDTISTVDYTANETVIMYAQWRPYQYTISYTSNNGNGTMDKQTVDYNANVSLLANLFTKEGYCFRGWFAKRKSDNNVYCTNGSQNKWFGENNIDSGYNLYLFSDEEQISDLSNVDSDRISMKAQWISYDDIMIGDVDLDGKVTVKDATEVQRYISGLVVLNDVQLYAADVYKDGVIDIKDATAIRQMAV